MKNIIFSFAVLVIFGKLSFAYTVWQQPAYTVTSSSITGNYQVYAGTYAFTDNITVSSAPVATYTPRIILDGTNGNASVYGVVLSTTQTNYQVGITTPLILGVIFWDNSKGEMCVSTGTANRYSYGKFSFTAP